MKLKNILIIILIAICVIIFGLWIVFKSNSIDKLIEDENVQVDTLINIYKDVVERNKEANIILGESALKNIITKENFTDENTLKIKSVEKNSAEFNVTCSLYKSYSKSKHVVTVTVIGDDGKTRNTEEYKLYVKDGKVEVEHKGGTMMFYDF